MKIGIDARMYGTEQGGLGRYVQQLILELENLNVPAEILIFLRKNNWDGYKPRSSNFKKVLADVPWYGFAEQTSLPLILQKNPVDLMHFPHWNVPLFYNKPFVVTIHDLLLLDHPTREASTLGIFSYELKQLGFKATLKHAAKNAKSIITVSNYSKKEIVNKLSISDKKIFVTYPAPSLERSNSREVLTKFGINQPYAYYLGVAYPHKNLDRLLKAWEIFLISNPHTQLVLSGKKNFFYGRLIEKNKKLFNEKKVIFTDYISDKESSELISNSKVFVFPSLYEGFGIPPVEAMNLGVPVAASNVTSIPEILEGAALFFNPEDPEEIARALDTLFSNEEMRSELINLGKSVAKKYNWKTLAKSTWEIYENSV